MSQFRIGDKVIVTDSGQLFSSAVDAANGLGLQYFIRDQFIGERFPYEWIWEVVAMDRVGYETRYGIRSVATDILISEKGLQLAPNIIDLTINMDPAYAAGSILHINANQENPMLDPQKELFETRTYILGNEAKVYSEHQLIAIIRDAEEEIAKLESIEVESKHVAKRVKKIKSDLKKVVAELDKRK